ncbi:MAG TPA: hypothetical protein VF803_01720 [Candidatus Paceibacterota bacterium]
MDDTTFHLTCRELLAAKQKESAVGTVLIVAAVGLSFFTEAPGFAWSLLLFGAGFIAAMWFDVGLVWYRMKKGFYGNDAEETRDLIRFISAKK